MLCEVRFLVIAFGISIIYLLLKRVLSFFFSGRGNQLIFLSVLLCAMGLHYNICRPQSFPAPSLFL